MRIPFIIFITFFMVYGARAAFNEELVLKQVSEDGTQFVFVRREGPPPWNGIVIKDPQTKVMLYEAKVTKCSPTACMGVVVNNHSGLKLRADESYVHSYNELPIKYEPKESELVKPEEKPVPPPSPVPEPPKPEPVVEEPKPIPPPPPAPVVEEKKVEPKPEPKPKVVKKPQPKVEPEKPSDLKQAGYASYGSPIGPGFKLGYFKKINESWYGVNYANISSTTNSVSVKGHALTGVGSFRLLDVSQALEVNFVAELGLVSAQLDFTGVSADGPVKDETTYVIALAGEGKLNFDRLSLAIKSGLSKAGFAGTYTGSNGEYNNPYGTALVFLELGAYYRF